MDNSNITKASRALSIILALLLLFTMIPGSLPGGFAYAEEIMDTDTTDRAQSGIIESGECGTNVTYVLYDDGQLVISGSGDMTNWKYDTKAPWYSKRNLIITVVVDSGVTSIGEWAFYDCSNIESIVIPDGVASIGFRAFYDCGSLESITIPESVTSLGDSAFHKCSSIKSLTIPDSVTSIGSGAFYGCSSLTSIAIPDGVTSIGTTTFYNCSSLESITVPGSVTSIGGTAFSGCSSLTSITIPESVTSIGGWAFYNCSSLTNITIPDGVASLKERTFWNCSNLESIIIPESVTSIGEWAFSGCSSLTDIYFDGTQAQWDAISIGSSNEPLLQASIHYKGIIASGYCGGEGDGTNLTWTLDDEGLLTISGKGEMASWYSSTSVPWYEYRDEIKTVVINNGVTNISQSAFWGCSNLASIEIPDGVASIGNTAFQGCSSLTSIVLPESVISIESYAFMECSGLTSITIPDSVTNLEVGVFRGCSSLTSITIPEGVTSIGNDAFMGCSNLASIEIPEGVTGIGDFAFNGCSNLASIEIPDSVTSIGERAFQGCSSLTSIEIPEGVTVIGYLTFSGCSSLTNIKIPESVTTIGRQAFQSCNSLTSIEIPEGVKYIDEFAFYNCISLTSIIIPDSVKSIYRCAFNGCSSLTSILIPEGVTLIDGTIFYGINNQASIYVVEGSYADTFIKSSEYSSMLKYVTKDGEHYWYEEITAEPGCETAGSRTLTCVKCGETRTEEITALGHNFVDGVCSRCGAKDPLNDWKYTISNNKVTITKYLGSDTDVVIPSTIEGYSVTAIGSSAFYECSSLNSIVIPEGVTSIGSSAFYECSSLNSIVIPEGVTSIGSNAFSYCSSLTSITIPDSVTSIGSGAFSDCSSLTDIVIPKGVTIIEDNTFDGCYNLKSIDLPYGITRIGNSAFLDVGLESIEIPDSVIIIENQAFWCSDLKNIIIPDSVTTIGDNAFSTCLKLESILIPESVTDFSPWILDPIEGCPALTSIYVVKDSNADTILSSGFQEVIKYVYKSDDHYYYEEITTEPGCETPGSKTITCVKCGETRTEEIAPLGHAYGDWTFDGEEAKTHTRVCANDSSHMETESCTFTETVDGTEATYTCSVCGGSYTREFLSVGGDMFNVQEPIMVTAYGSENDWVGLYKADETPGEDQEAFFWYYVAEHNGEPFDILQGKGGNRNAEFTAGEYKIVYCIDDSYTVKASVNLTIIHKSSIETDNTEYTVKDAVMVTAYSDYPDAWVGLYEYDNSVPLDSTLICYYNVENANGAPVDILHDERVEFLTDERSFVGHYKVILFTGGYNIDEDGELMIRSFWINDVYNGPDWMWNEDYTEASAIFKGETDPDDTKTVAAVISSEIIREATEDEEGIVEYTATVESVDFATNDSAPFTDVKEVWIPKLPHTHSLELIPKVEPSCLEEGSKAYYVCSKCGKYFEDADGTAEITDLSSIVISPLGHDYHEIEGTAVEPTPWEPGKKADQQCSRCGDIKTGEEVYFTIDSLEVILAEEITLIENTGGRYTTNEIYDPETDSYIEEEFYYYDIYLRDKIHSEGNKIIVNDNEIFSYDGMNFVNDDGEYLYSKYGELNIYQNQYKKHWTLGSDNHFTVSLLNKSYDVTVTITENPIDTIQFIPANEITLIENYEGYYTTVQTYDPETESYVGEEFFYYYFNNGDIYTKGNKIIINGNEEFTYKRYMNESGGYEGDFINDEGESLTSKYGYPEVSNDQYSKHWTLGNDNHFTITVLGKTCEGSVTVVRNPINTIEFIPFREIICYENMGGVMDTSSVYDPETDSYVYEQFFRYDTWNPFTEGNKIVINGNEEFVYKAYEDDYGNTSYAFIDSNGEKLSDKYDEVVLSSDQYSKHWTLGSDNHFTIRILGKTGEGTVTILENPVKTIEFIPAKPLILYENSYGYTDTRYNEETGENESFFHYSIPRVTEPGNKLIINGEKVYTYESGRGFVDEDGVRFGRDLGYEPEWFFPSDDQISEPWTVGNEYTFTVQVEYTAFSFECTVSIVENPVDSIEFVPAKPFEVVENVNGHTTTRYNEETGEYEEYFFYMLSDDYFRPRIYHEGNQLIVNEDQVFTCSRINGKLGFYNENGEALKDIYDELEWRDNQEYDPWVRDKDSYFLIRLLGKECRCPVTIIDNPVETLEFVPAEELRIIDGTGGHTEYDNVYDPETDSYHQEAFYYYDISNYVLYNAGNRIIINGSEEFVCQEYLDDYGIYTNRFMNDDGELLTDKYGDLNCYSDQMDNHWTVENDYQFTLELLTKTCKGTATIIESPVQSMVFVPAEELECMEKTGGWYATTQMYDPGTDTYYDEEFYYYYCDNLVNSIDNKIIINGDEVFTCQNYMTDPYSSEECFVNEDGELLRSKYGDLQISADDQWENHWVAGNEYTFNISLLGATAEGTVKITENPVRTIEFIPSEFELLEGTNGGMQYREYWDEETQSYVSEEFFCYEPYNSLNKDGNQIVVNGTDVYTYGEYCLYDDWYTTGFHNENNEEIEITSVYDTQYDEPWIVGGTYTVTVEYMGAKDDVTFTIVENPVLEIGFEPAVPITLICEVDGNWNTIPEYDEDGNWTGEKEVFIYNADKIREQGNKLTVTTENGTKEYYYDEEAGGFCDSDGNCIIQGDEVVYDYYDEQVETPWTLGDDNYLTVTYMGHSCKVPVTIIENPVASIKYIPAQDLMAYFTPGSVEIINYNIWFNNGDVIEVTNKDGSVIRYTYGYSPIGRAPKNFIGDDGSVKSIYDFYLYIVRDDPTLHAGDDYAVRVKAFGRESEEVPLTMLEDNVRSVSLELTHPVNAKEYDYETITLDDGTEGIRCWWRGRAGDMGDLQHYAIFRQGDAITVTDTEGKVTVYTFEEDKSLYGFFDAEGKELPSIFLTSSDNGVYNWDEPDQSKRYWSADKENEIYFSYLGHEAEPPIKVSIEDVEYSLGDAEVTVGSAVYTGSELKPEVTVTYNGKKLTEGVDYTVSYENNVNAGKGTVTVTGTGKYTGVKTVEFIITPQSATPVIKLEPNKFVYDGKEHLPDVTVTVNNKEVPANIFMPSNCVNPGVYTVKVSLIGNYTGSATADFEITHEHAWDEGKVTQAATCESEGVKTFTCTVCGETKTEVIAATGHSFRDRVVSPICIAEGYTEHVCSTCGYSYRDEIKPALGHDYQDVEGTAVAATCEAAGKKADSKCTRCGDTKTGEAVPALGHDWGEWTVTKEATTEEEGVETRVCSRDASHTETRAIPKKDAPEIVVESVSRIFGATRFETSLKVADELKELLSIDKFDTVILAYAYNYADALAGSYLSCILDAPILLVDARQDHINAVQSYIRSNLKSGGTIYMLGGSAVVPESAVAGLSGYKVNRLWGQDRYETNIAILKEAAKFASNSEIIVASGNGFADSLSAAATGKPILLVRNTLQEGQKKYLKSLGGGMTFDIVGGTGAVSDSIMKELNAYGSTNRTGGSTRFETSVNIAKKFFNKPDVGVLAYGQAFPDGLCGGALAHAMGGPLILTANGKTDAAIKYAGEAGMKYGAVLGGPTLIDDASVRAIYHMSSSAKILVK